MTNLLTRLWVRNQLIQALIISLLVLSATRAEAQERTLRGYVGQAGTSEPIGGATLLVLGTRMATRTDSTGYFALTVPRGPLQLGVYAVTWQSDTLDVAAGTDSVYVLLNPTSFVLEPIAVTVPEIELQRFETTAQASIVTLETAEIRRVPGLLEADVLRAVQLLPGTVSRNDYTVGFNVRGGEADQNLILLDGLTVFNPSHLGGLFSTFDAEAVGQVDFQTGGFGARYPGRLSSVVDIRLREGAREQTRVSGQISLLTSKVLVEGPAGPGTYIAGIRRTYADAVIGALSSAELPYYFTDAVGRYTLPFRSGGTLSLSGYWGRDALDLNITDAEGNDEDVNLEFNWGNRLLGARLNLPVGASILEANAGVSEFSTTLGLLPGIARYDNTARLLTAGASLAFFPGSHVIRAGATVESFDMDYLLRSPDFDVTLLDESYRPTVLAGFVEDEWRASEKLLLRPGVRVEHVTGAAFTSASPRLAAKVFLNRRTALTGSLARYYQAIHSIRDQEQPFTIFEFWVGADTALPVARSDHGVLGIERWFDGVHSLNVEVYRKAYHNLVTPNREEDFRVSGDEYVPVVGHSNGLDVMLRRHQGEIRGWISWGFVHSRRRSPLETYPPAHDRGHTINAVMELPGPLGSDMSVRWGFGSPLPYTGFVGEWNHREYSPGRNGFTSRRKEPIGAAINGERYPHYSRLDVGFRWETRGLGGILRPYLNIVNAYNRRNVFIYFFDYSDSPVTRSGVSQLPFVPTFGLEFEW